MSGIRWASFRSGDRAELLADFLLSSIGVATPVRRQDDLGVDFHCQLADEHPEGYISYRSPFIIQIKSNIGDGIQYGSKDPSKWRQAAIAWLFENKVPFLIGEVNLEKASLAIYDTSALWQVYNKSGAWASQIELRVNAHPEGEMRFNVDPQPIENWQPGCGDGYKYIVDLGNPLVEFSYWDLDNRGRMDGKKALLTSVLYIEQKNIINRDLRMHIFTEIKENSSPGYSFQTGQFFGPHPDFNVDIVLNELHDGLVSVLIKLKDEGKEDASNALKGFLKFVPRTRADDTLYQADSKLFDYLASEANTEKKNG